MNNTPYLFDPNSSVCPSDQPADAQLGHPDVPARVLELVLRRHGGVLRALLPAGAGGHAGGQHLRTTRYNTEARCMTTPSAVETPPC